MSNLLLRILSSISLVILSIFAICWNPWSQWLLLSTVFLLASFEISIATRSRYSPNSSLFFSFFILPPCFYTLLQFIPPINSISFTLEDINTYYFIYIILLFFFGLFNPKTEVKNRFPWSLYQVAFLFLIPTWFSTFFKILTPFETWNPLFWNCILVVTLSDSSAYFVGRAIGKNRMLSLSPKKTFEGFLGGLIISIIIASFFTSFWISIPLYKIIILNFILSFCSTLGDFFFSALKRHFEIKDFSNIIPGHGGILDRFDSILFTVPIAYFLSSWIL